MMILFPSLYIPLCGCLLRVLNVSVGQDAPQILFGMCMLGSPQYCMFDDNSSSICY